MATLEDDSSDLVLTDPPYPNLKGEIILKGGGVAEVVNRQVVVGDLWNANLDWVPHACRIAKYGVVCFCSYANVAMFHDAFSVAGLACRGLGVWYKRNSPNPVNNVPKFTTEYFWMFQKSPGLKWSNIETMIDEPMPSAGCFATERLLLPGTKAALHPAQKPVKLISEILKIGGDSVLDCFMGTGTTGEACAIAKRSFVGIERDNTYFPVARDRIEAAYRKAQGLPRQGKPTDTTDLPMFMEVAA